MTESSYADFGLSVIPCKDGVVFGMCRHMEVTGWPKSKTGRMDIAQELSKKEHGRYMLPKPLSTKLSS